MALILSCIVRPGPWGIPTSKIVPSDSGSASDSGFKEVFKDELHEFADRYAAKLGLHKFAIYQHTADPAKYRLAFFGLIAGQTRSSKKDTFTLSNLAQVTFQDMERECIFYYSFDTLSWKPFSGETREFSVEMLRPKSRYQPILDVLELADEDVPEAYIDTLSEEIMAFPVKMGSTYADLETLRGWALHTPSFTLPHSREPRHLGTLQIDYAHALRISEWLLERLRRSSSLPQEQKNQAIATVTTNITWLNSRKLASAENRIMAIRVLTEKYSELAQLSSEQCDRCLERALSLVAQKSDRVGDTFYDSLQILFHYAHVSPNAVVGPKGQTALHLALRAQRYTVAHLLLQYGAKLDIPDNDGITTQTLIDRLDEPNKALLLSPIPQCRLVDFEPGSFERRPSRTHKSPPVGHQARQDKLFAVLGIGAAAHPRQAATTAAVTTTTPAPG